MRLALAAVLLSFASGAFGHMSQQNRAMNAEVVVEIFIDSKELRIELEFPHTASAPEERALSLAPVLTANRQVLPAPELRALTTRPRTIRDAVTGEAVDSPSNPRTVHFAIFAYPLSSKPQLVSIAPPGGAPRDYGFLVSHLGLAVNHFHYLRQEEVLTLNWDDPFYSRFRNSGLKRAFSEPLELFLTREGDVLQLDILVRPRDLAPSLGFAISSPGPGDPDPILAAIPNWARKACALSAQDGPQPFLTQQTTFISRTLRRTAVLSPGDRLDGHTALVAISMQATIPAQESTFEFHWNWFTPRIQRVPLTITSGTERTRHLLAPDQPMISWDVPVALPPERPALPAATARPEWRLPQPGILLASLLLAWALLARRKTTSPSFRIVMAVAVPFIVGILLMITGMHTVVRDPFARSEPIPTERADLICHDLLLRAFQLAAATPPGESLAHALSPVLESGASKPSLAQLAADSTGPDGFGSQRRLRRLILHRTDYRQPPNTFGFTATSEAELYLGSIHWGHLHNERKRPTVTMTIEPVDHQWKITELDYQPAPQGAASNTDR